MATLASPTSDDEGWLVDNEKSAGSTHPGVPAGASASHAFYGLASISEDGNFDTRSGQSFSRALLLLKHEHERELCAVQARCDLELQALRGELASKITGSAGTNDVPGFGSDKRLHRPIPIWSTVSAQSPPASEAPSFAADAHVGVLRAESPSVSGRLQQDLSPTPMRRLLLDKASSPGEDKSAARHHFEVNPLVGKAGALWELAVAQGRKELSGSISDESSPQAELAQQGLVQAAHKTVYSSWFGYTCCFIIFLNCVIMGVAADSAARSGDPDAIPVLCMVASRIFSVWFVIELILRFIADGRHFWKSKEFVWNILDLVLVMIDVVEVVIEASIGRGKMFDASALRVLRMFRILKTGRLLRLVSFCRELRIMLSCILKSFAPLLWVFVLLALLIFVFSLWLVQITTGHLFDTEGEQLPERQAVHREALINMFGTMTDALYTLFRAVTGGISWGIVNAALIDIHWINGVIFAFYIFFFVFAASNIVTSVFLEQVLRSAHLDKQELLQTQIEGKDSAFFLLKMRFEAADVSGSGNLSILEFNKLLEDQMVSAYLRMMGVEVHEARGLCHLLGHETTGISIDEFMAGCLRLQGDIRSIDVAVVMHENKQTAALVKEILGANLNVLGEVRKELSSFQTLHSEVPPVAEEGAVESMPAIVTLPHSPREDLTGLLPQSPLTPQTPQSPLNSEGGSPRGADTPRSDSPHFGGTAGLDLLSVPTSTRPWAGDPTTASCGVPPAVRG